MSAFPQRGPSSWSRSAYCQWPALETCWECEIFTHEVSWTDRTECGVRREKKWYQEKPKNDFDKVKCHFGPIEWKKNELPVVHCCLIWLCATSNPMTVLGGKNRRIYRTVMCLLIHFFFLLFEESLNRNNAMTHSSMGWKLWSHARLGRICLLWC